jgi:hypothetical protein
MQISANIYHIGDVYQVIVVTNGTISLMLTYRTENEALLALAKFMHDIVEMRESLG